MKRKRHNRMFGSDYRARLMLTRAICFELRHVYLLSKRPFVARHPSRSARPYVMSISILNNHNIRRVFDIPIDPHDPNLIRRCCETIVQMRAEHKETGFILSPPNNAI